MAFYDIFNGDADGICALHQLRLTEPREATLVTGIKRDIKLLRRVHPEPGDQLTVLDISLDENRGELLRALEQGAACRYFDHHYCGEIPRHPRLQAFIDTSPDICTSLLVDRHLQGRQRPWAVAAAFGDNLHEAARRAAEPLRLAEPELERLRELGECINYNAYGESVEDLHFHPAELYRALHPYADPFAFMAEHPAFEKLRQGYREDMARAAALPPEPVGSAGAAVMLPDAAWSRRANGVLANRLSRAHPERAHAVLVKTGEHYMVSVRAPLARPTGADTLCRRFPTGGGRKGAGGINRLPATELQRFLKEFSGAFGPAG